MRGVATKAPTRARRRIAGEQIEGGDQGRLESAHRATRRPGLLRPGDGQAQVRGLHPRSVAGRKVVPTHCRWSGDGSRAERKLWPLTLRNGHDDALGREDEPVREERAEHLTQIVRARDRRAEVAEPRLAGGLDGLQGREQLGRRPPPGRSSKRRGTADRRLGTPATTGGRRASGPRLAKS